MKNEREYLMFDYCNSDNQSSATDVIVKKSSRDIICIN